MRARRCGPIAHEVLAEDGELRVLAVFERSFYLACPRGIVCVGSGIGAGPITVEIAAPQGGTWEEAGIVPDLKGRIEHGVPFITEHLALDIAAASIWHPPPAPAFAPGCASTGLARLRAAAVTDAPGDGLALLVLTGHAPPGNVEARMAQASIGDLRTGLARALAGGGIGDTLARPATLLVGLGPGLTPSGDDLLAGLMLALSVTGHESVRDALWHALTPELDALTVPISAMHLSAAADGLAGEAMHVLVSETLAGGPALSAPLRDAVRTGHTSGWDTVAGLVLGLEVILASV